MKSGVIFVIDVGGVLHFELECEAPVYGGDGVGDATCYGEEGTPL